MGNSQQLGAEYGSIYVRTEKPFYFSGEVVLGTSP
jgi:hypothetical protein